MTVTNQNSRDDYVSNGSATSYAFTFKILSEEDIQVIVTNLSGVETVLTLTTNYTVTIDPDTGLGNITLVTAATVNFKISLLRNMDFEQNTAIQNQGTSQFAGKSFEQALDKLTLLSQQLKEIIGRNLSLKKSSLLSGITIEDPVVGKVLTVGPDGNIINTEIIDLGVGGVATAFWQSILIDSLTEAEARQDLGLEIGVDVQAQNANLSALAGLTGSLNKIPYFTAMGAMGVADLPSNRNAIINGDFNIWQLGTTFSSIADSAYSADRWLYQKVGTMVHNISRSTDVPTVAQAGRLFNYSLLVDCTTPDTSIAAGDFALIRQKIEGYNFLPLAQKIITFSFWVKATKTGIYCVFAGNSTVDRSYIGEYTINASNTWEYKTVTLAASPNAGTWDYTNGVGLNIGFALAAGSTFQATAGAWQTGSFNATSNQVNACDSASNDFRIVGVQLEAGSVATPFENRTIQDELRLCERYHEKSYNQSVVAGTIDSTGTKAYSNQNAQQNLSSVSFKVPKRANPTIIVYSPITGVAGKMSLGAVDVNAVVYAFGENGFYVGPATATVLTNLFYQYSAISEL